ncbi:MAG: hypothetical protein IJT28_03415 [Bacteroidaceae bacterium]|nr:hypothetical protein [Bacteroidaceae bacterium]MBR6892962.1 hypothetical protein [Bacteroidaceae bacterium]
MKKISVLMAAFMAVCMSALADDGIKVSPLTIAQGETADLEIMFESAEAKYVGYQFDVTTEGLGFNIDLDEEEGYDGGSALAKSHTIAASEPTAGTYRFLCSSNKNATIKAGSNVLMTISLRADAELEPGTYKVTISNIEFSDGKSPYKFDPVEATVTVTVPTAIKSTSASKQTKGTYNVAGQQVEMQKGINIVDGKKVMVR